MADEYVLLMNIGGRLKFVGPLHAPTPEEAGRQADALVAFQKKDKGMNVKVEGKLFQFLTEVDGEQFFKKVDEINPQLPLVPFLRCVAAYKKDKETVHCNHLGPETEFKMGNQHRCPKCDSEDIFPERWYRCKKCGLVQDQQEWFGEDTDLDNDPIQSGEEAEPCEGCIKKYEQSQIGVTTDETLDEYYEKLRELEHTPAELEEVQVEFTEPLIEGREQGHYE